MRAKSTRKYVLPEGPIVPFTMNLTLPESYRLVHLVQRFNKYRYIYEISPRRITINYAGKAHEISIPWTYFVVTDKRSTFYVSSKQIKDFKNPSFRVFYPNTCADHICWGSVPHFQKTESIVDFHVKLMDNFFNSNFGDGMGRIQDYNNIS